MAAESDPPQPKNIVQRAADTQAAYATGFQRLLAKEAAMYDRLIALAEQDDNLPAALSATKDALDRIERMKHATTLSEERPCTDDELREADAIAERLRAKKGT